MDYRKRAEQIHKDTRPDPRIVAMMGESMLSPVQRATVDEIENHLRLVDEVAAEFDTTLDAAKVTFGATREQIAEKAEAKAKRYRRRAGVRALQRKYGHDAAERIVSKHAGRHITLRR